MTIPTGTGEQKDYISYLLRIWRDRGDEKAGASREPPWRASLQSPRTGEMESFASLDDLFDYLRGQAGLQMQGEDEQGDGEDMPERRWPESN